MFSPPTYQDHNSNAIHFLHQAATMAPLIQFCFSMLHHMRLHTGPFHRIKTGRQIFEIRINDEKRRMLKVHDTIEFTERDSESAKYTKLITQLIPADSFLNLFNQISTVEAGYPERTTPEEAAGEMAIYYSATEEKKWGVVKN